LVSKEYKKIERVVNFMKKGLQSLSDDLDDTVKGINDFIKSLNKALKDLKDVSLKPEVQTVSSSSKRVVTPASGTAKTAAASTLFSLLSGSAGPAQQVPAATTASVAPAIGVPPTKPGKKGPPKAPVAGGPPKRPATSGPPRAPVSGAPPKRANLPPAPKLPPTSGGPPQAPGTGVVQAPSFAKRPAPPAAPVAGGPPRPPAPVATPTAGGGLSSLRDEMLEELNRLKKIMRGE
jgi:hypothetical protein